MTDHKLIEWLLQNGGPAVRCRTAADLLDEPAGVDLCNLEQELLDSPQVRLWLDRLAPDGLHSSKNTAFENVMGKLAELGLRAGMVPLDWKVRHFREWLNSEEATSREFSHFYRGLVAGALARLGYQNDVGVRAFLLSRLDRLYEWTRRGSYDIYLDDSAIPGLPKAYRGKPILKPEMHVYPGGESLLPSIHDVYGLANLPPDSGQEGRDEKISAVVGYVLRPEYQALRPDYGYFHVDGGRRRRFHSMGWGVHLPGYHGFGFSDGMARYFVQRVELMARFPLARSHRWFRESLRHPENHRTERGTYLFPGRYLRELRQGYYVTGAYMGLEENRRSRRNLEIESTLRMLTVKRLSGKG